MTHLKSILCFDCSHNNKQIIESIEETAKKLKKSIEKDCGYARYEFDDGVDNLVEALKKQLEGKGE